MKPLSPLAQKYKEAFEGYMFVFDIDGTLWWFWMDTHPDPPVKPYKGGFKDSYKTGEVFDFYPDVREILLALHEAEIPIALASSTWAPELGKKLIRIMKMDEKRTLGDIVDYQELITSQKFEHFRRIRDASGYSYEQMIFIDDEKHNIDDIETLGVICYYERKGISKEVFEKIMRDLKKV